MADGECVRVTDVYEASSSKGSPKLLHSTVEHAENILVELGENADLAQFKTALQERGGKIVLSKDRWKLYKVTFDTIALSETKVELVMGQMTGIPGIARVMPLSILRSYSVPSDGMYGIQWHHNNTGQWGGTPGVDIKSEEAWSKQRYASNIVAAVIDTGVFTSHYDLQNNLWVNPGEIAGNNIDDDVNGYTNDVNGFNFITRSGNPNPIYDVHGTAVAGCIGAEANNLTGWNGGVVGVAWDVQLMCLNVGSAPQSIDILAVIEAVQYAIDNGADIINCSFGGPGQLPAAFSNVFYNAKTAGIPVVIAAGNSGLNIDTLAEVDRPAPARLPYDNIVVVMASDQNDNRPNWSNYGQTRTDLAAPGVSIVTVSTNSYTALTNMSGTSFSAPIVSGALALMKEKFPRLSYSQLIDRLLSTVDPVPALANLTATGGRLNLNKALNYIFQDCVRFNDGWRWNDWFGFFRDEYYPWTYHMEHRWLYSVSVFATDMWFYDPNPQIGWFWTTDAVYPNIWSSAQNAWLSYSEGTGGDDNGPRWFYNYTTAQWMAVYHAGSSSSVPPPNPL